MYDGVSEVFCTSEVEPNIIMHRYEFNKIKKSKIVFVQLALFNAMNQILNY